MVPAAPVARAVPLRLARRARDVTVAVAVESREGLWDVKYSISDVDAEKMKGWKKPIRVAVSGAAGQIANHLLFQLCSGEVFGNDQPIILQLLGSERSREALEGVCMELEDSMYPLLREVQVRAVATRAWQWPSLMVVAGLAVPDPTGAAAMAVAVRGTHWAAGEDKKS